MAQCDRADGHDTTNCCDRCHAENESSGEYMNDGFDVEGNDLHVCCQASIASYAARDERRRKASQ